MSDQTKFKKPMDGAEFQECLNRAGLAQKQYAAMIGVKGVAIAKRKAGTTNIPPEGALLLRVMAQRPEIVDLVWEAAGRPEGVEISPAGRPPKGFK